MDITVEELLNALENVMYKDHSDGKWRNSWVEHEPLNGHLGPRVVEALNEHMAKGLE